MNTILQFTPLLRKMNENYVNTGEKHVFWKLDVENGHLILHLMTDLQDVHKS